MLARIAVTLILSLAAHEAFAHAAIEKERAFPGGEADKDVQALIRSIMSERYGNRFIDAYGCWSYETKDARGEPIQYCMKAGRPELVDVDGVRTLYFMSYNRDDIRGNADFRYAHYQLGLMGAFKATHDDSANKWVLRAGSKDMESGSMGSCGCSDAAFTRLGPGKYGWIFETGGDWQGTQAGNYFIVADFDGLFSDVSAIPDVEEAAQDINYEVSIIRDAAAPEMYPLLVKKMKKGKQLKEFHVAFDAAKRIYKLP